MIACDPKINFGQPALQGRRLTVFDIVTKVYYGNSLILATEDYGILLKEIKEAVDYCLTLKCKIAPDRVHYCYGCILRTIEEGWNFDRNEYMEFEKDDAVRLRALPF